MRRLADTPELLDGPLDHELLTENLRDLMRANRWLGGTALSRRALITLATGFHMAPRVGRAGWRERPLRLLDVGTGAADIPETLQQWTARRGIRLEVEAIDSRIEVLDVAFERLGDRPELHLEQASAEKLPYPDGAFDIAHASLLAHHLEPGGVAGLLSEMARVSQLGVIVNDLDRARRFWIGAWLLANLVGRNRYTRHDAPLSVRRAYRPTEVAQLAARAGLVEVGRFRGYLGHRYALAFVHAEPVQASADG